MFIVSVLVCSCATNKEFMVYNGGLETVQNVRIRSDSGFEFSWGILIPGSYKGMLVRDEYPLTDRYALFWEKEGRETSAVIDLATELPSYFINGEIVFKINDDGSVTLFYGAKAFEDSVMKDRREQGLIP
jgi:hypothetical protein